MGPDCLTIAISVAGMATRTRTEVAVEAVEVSASTIPTDAPEQDGTYAWDSTTIVVCEAHGGGETGLGYTYGPKAVGAVVEELLEDVVRGTDAGAPAEAWRDMGARLRNAGLRD